MLESSLDAAKIISVHLLSKDAIMLTLVHKNENGTHAELIDKSSGTRHHVKFSTEPFYTFGNIFKKYKGSFGDSLDDAVVKTLNNDDDMLYFAYPDKIFSCSAKRFKSEKLIRTNSRGVITWSIPLHKLDLVWEEESVEVVQQ